MKVRVDRPLRCDDTTIAPGRYEAEVDEARSAVVLTRDGAPSVTLAAMLRPSKAAVRKSKIELRQVADAPRRLLVARTPPANEWVVPLEEDG